MIEVLTNNHYEKILDLFDGTERNIRIISPFLSMSTAEKLCSVVKSKPEIKCTFITRFYLEDFLNKVNSLNALDLMIDSGIEIFAVRGLHTKLYLFDSQNGILGSANFTTGGFFSNVELSLHIQEEVDLLSNLHSYFSELIDKIKLSDEGTVTKDLIAKTMGKYQTAYMSKKSKPSSISTFMFGAATEKRKRLESSQEILDELKSCQSDTDIIHDLFKEAEKRELVNLDHTIWMKFGGEGNDRIFGEYEMTKVLIDGKETLLSCYPWKPSAVREDDEIYLAALTFDQKDKAQPVIVGRGKLKAFRNENYIQDTWIKDYPWMERYPWYCVIKEIKFLNTDVKNGVPLDAVLAELGSDTYISSFGKNESIADVAKKHYQKAHIRLTGNAKVFIDKDLDKLEKTYGVKSFPTDDI